MKKIMFNDKYGQTADVLQGRKTMMRMMVQNKYLRIYEDMSRLGQPCYPMEEWLIRRAAPYKIDEVVAVAQAYKSIEKEILAQGLPLDMKDEIKHHKGYNNKIFVHADFMPHHIRITDIKVERLQDISDEDCFKEGIIPITWRQHLQQDFDDFSPQKYIDHNVYTLEKFREGIEDCWAESDPNEYMAEEAKVAFAVLIFKMFGRKVWESNPWVFVYSFRLEDQERKRGNTPPRVRKHS